MVTGIRFGPEPVERRSWVPLVLVALSVVLALWVYRGQASPPVDLNDSGLHLSTTEWVADRIGDGHQPFDGWYPYLGLGFPQTHQYQSLPHVLTGLAGLVVGVENAYHWSLYLLLAGWPLAVYTGGRLLGISRWSAAFAALVAPWVVSEPGYGYEAGSYTWQGLGIWPQLWAAWLLPVALGLSWRAVRAEGSPLLAGAALGACALCHLLTGWLALAIVVLLPLLHWSDVRARFGRLALALAAAAAAVAWFVVPLFLDGEGADYTGYDRGTFWYDSYGASRVLGWLASGELLDAGRLPVVTVLAAVGLVVTALRARAPGASRAVLLLAGLSLVLFFGRPTLGPVLDLLPFGRDLFFPRFIIGVHLGAVLLAGVGAAWLATRAVHLLAGLGPHPLAVAVVAVAAVLVLAPVLRDGVQREDRGRAFMATQRDADVENRDRDDALALIRAVKGSPGRLYAGSLLGWGNGYAIGFVPMYAQLLRESVDAVGFQLRVSSLATAAESAFDETNPAHLRAFGVQWMLLPDDRRPEVPATLVGNRGRHRLWRITSVTGYAEVVDGTGPVLVDGSPNIGFAEGSRPLISWHGRVGDPTVVTERLGAPGRVGVSVVAPEDGRFTFRVVADRAAYVALAASWHPRWQVTVDGERRDVVMIAPGTAAVRVGAGEHAVTFQYAPFPHTWALVLLGALALGALWAGPRQLARARVPSEPRPAGRVRRRA